MARSRPHLLYVAWGFPPSRGGGVYRALATANRAVAAGFDVTVLTAQTETFARFTGTDDSLLPLVDPSVKIVRIPFKWPARETDIRKYSPMQALAPRVWWQVRKRMDRVRFPEVAYGPWRRNLELAALAIHARRPVDLVLATANPNVDLAAAACLHRRHGIPYVVDYRDAWLLDVFDGTQTHPDRSRAAQWEKRLFTAATEVWFVNDPIRKWHEQRYPNVADRMFTVSNGYDAGLAPVPRPTGPVESGPLRFGFIGTVSGRVPMAEFVAGWQRAYGEARFAGNTAQIWGYLGFYATPSPVLMRLLDAAGEFGVTYEGPVAKRDVRTVYDGFDALLLILGAGRYVTSGKVFEYTASALPIVSVHEPTNAASDVLRGYPLWFPVTDLSPDAIASALLAAADAARTASPDTRRACAEFATRYAREAQLDPRLQSLLTTATRSAE